MHGKDEYISIVFVTDRQPVSLVNIKIDYQCPYIPMMAPQGIDGYGYIRENAETLPFIRLCMMKSTADVDTYTTINGCMSGLYRTSCHESERLQDSIAYIRFRQVRHFV